MTETTKYVKITIIVEDGEQITTIRIPKACDATIEHKRDPVEHSVGTDHRATYLTDQLGIDIGLTALFDYESGRIYTTEVKKVGEDD